MLQHPQVSDIQKSSSYRNERTEPLIQVVSVMNTALMRRARKYGDERVD